MTREFEPVDPWMTPDPSAMNQHSVVFLSNFARQEQNGQLIYANVYGHECCECYHVSMSCRCPNKGCSNPHDKETCPHRKLVIDKP